MKNKKTVVFILILLIIIFAILTFLIISDYKGIDNKNKDKEGISEKIKKDSEFNIPDGMSVKSLNLKKDENGQFLLSILINKEDISYSDALYSLYLLDKDNNLLYKFDDLNFNQYSTGEFTLNYDISFDISTLKKVVICDSNTDFKYNKDLSNSLQYIGER